MDVFCSVSKKEIEEVESILIPSLQSQKGIDNINLTLINYPGKEKIYSGKEKLGKITIKEVSANKSLGYGEAHNFAFKTIKPKRSFLITNPGYLHNSCILNLQNIFADNIALVEARQLPFSHPKEFDTKTKETPWASGACVLVNSKFFEEVGGFDENFWMYNEDVDLSWRAWIEGYKVLFQDQAVIYHFTGVYFNYHPSRYYFEHFWSLRNFIYLCYKYWGKKGEIKAIRMIKSSKGVNKRFVKSVLHNYGEFKKSVNPERLRSKDDNGFPEQVKLLGLNKFHKMHNFEKQK